jgi:predicted dehydrogenase/threonine dehydrogenase-like Zn-dependent dehydrogenase
MKQIAQYQDGRLEVQDVPAPQAPYGGILVQTTHSVISPGTEKMKVEQAKMNLAQKAMARPDQVRKVLDSARTLGWKAALEKVKNRLSSPTPLGYSAAGIVLEVHSANTRFRVGDRVACAGAECANHGEMMGIPDLLAAPIPDDVANWQAAYTTLGAISMQAVRQAHASVGDRVLVVGQGLIGLLATNILAASGVRVMGVDLNERRLGIAKVIGAERVVNAALTNLADAVREWTAGFGVDQVLLCLGGKDPKPAQMACTVLRDRGTLVIVGIYDATLEWKTYYMKDIRVHFSRSYGPGRYDAGYEWGGRDYPIGYVKWTENRNFEACLHLMETGQLHLDAVTTHRDSFANVKNVYAALMRPGNEEVGVVLEYGAVTSAPSAASAAQAAIQTALPPEGKLTAACPELSVIGAGNFARTMLLPSLKGKVPFGAIVNNTPLSAQHVKNKFGFADSSTDATQAFDRGPNKAVLISTRHHLHAPLVLGALHAGQHVFVEKPLCLTREEMAQIDGAMQTTSGTVMVGFNRRFAPASVALKKALETCPGPKAAAAQIFAGKLDHSHWYANYDESGGRVLGEACHFFDYLCFLFASKPVRVTAQTIWPAGGHLPFPDSVTAQIEFADGSCGQVIYTAEGDYAYPKEVITVYAAGFVGHIENFTLQGSEEQHGVLQVQRSC